jgi:signal transduction histidine kinase
MCSLLLEEEFGALTDEQREFIKSMHESAAHMLEIVNQMLEITKIDAGKLTLNYTSFDLVSLIRKNIEVNKLWASKKEIDIGFTSPYQELVVYGDGGKISQVVDNLLSNAIKYSHRGRPIRVSLSRDNDTVHVAVEDNGQGIPEEELHKIFTPFAKLSVTSTEGEQSTGLGLAICKRIIEGHGGEIHVESTKGEGSTFTFSIPVDGTA